MKYYFITSQIKISRTVLISIIKTCLIDGGSLHWVMDYAVEGQVLKLLTVDDRIYQVRREDIMISLRKSLNIFWEAIFCTELNANILGTDGANLVLELAACGQLQYEI